MPKHVYAALTRITGDQGSSHGPCRSTGDMVWFIPGFG
jgi:hypothetical protein